MREWCLEHPIMTFLIIMGALDCLSHALCRCH